MFKFLLFLTILTVVASCPHGHSHKCHRNKLERARRIYNCRRGNKVNCKAGQFERREPRDYNKYDEDQYEELLDVLTRDLKRIDDHLRKTCDANGNADTRELFGTIDYSLFIPLPGVRAQDIVVKTKYRFLYVYARRFPPAKGYTEIKRLPKLVDASKGSWEYDGSELTVRFSYVNADTNDGNLYKCGPEYNNSWVTIPSEDEDNIDIDIRYSPQSSPVKGTEENHETSTTPLPELELNEVDSEQNVLEIS